MRQNRITIGKTEFEVERIWGEEPLSELIGRRLQHQPPLGAAVAAEKAGLRRASKEAV